MSNLEDEFLKLIETEFDKPNSNSILLSVRSGSGRVLFEATAGEGEIDSPYFVASISKMFTATVIMQLVEEGCLSLDDTIDEYLPHLRLEGIHVFRGTDYSHQLKVYQLLHQTSGLADYFAKGLDEDFKKNRDRLYSVEDVLDLIRGQSPFAAPDSGRSHYSDTNYQLLGALIEVVAERPLAELFAERIFARLEMADTYLFDHTIPREKEPLQFFCENTQLSLPLALTSERGAGGCVSTMQDNYRFLRGYFEGELFNKTYFERMTKWNRMFFPMHYGYGLWRFQLPRWLTLFQKMPEFIGHAGVNGAMAFYNPEKDLYITGTLNQIDDPARQFKFMPKIVGAVK
ncbi:CubicO group peptidase, beta-lactamase class C family [Cognatiyoonia sediminum]|uniref:CubicO group peptidase, beta-lactamase class C family n=1 Tax=Cognatiyoonia sediminum TaxID=1508389 RepID=A0A1M5T7J3_9RHOB|nr:serine hydrolase domain-containing protein [Cognatiyoonia sediminum]SHH46709.1 CubicO group peptidase, beta-lactamase class C family [Cognatiyoonia sediminum]